MKIYVSRTHAGLELATFANGYRVSRLYIGYTLKDAKRLFRVYVKESADK